MVPPYQKHWDIATEPPPEADQELSRYSILSNRPILRRILYQRGYTTAEAAQSFIEAKPPLGNAPENLLGMQQAVDRIRYAIRHHERIAIYGDYDADGVTATALLTHSLGGLGADVRGYIPNRFDEGYGLNIDALTSLREAGVRLVITVDCGMRSLREVNHARQIGLDLIITDHHSPGGEQLDALAVINPKQEGDLYPDKRLAGVGLAYKLACALLEPDGASYDPDAPAGQYLDLVALGTITDLAPLVGENRSLVRAGLEQIRHPHRQGVQSLIGAAQINAARITSEQVSFALGPRLNAAGRLESALAALNLLLATQVDEAARLAQLLDNQNRERQQITRQIQAHAEQVALAQDPEALVLIAVDESYNPGVIGLAASRLTEQYYRPAIVATRGDEFTRASCRSIPEFHITHALDECADLLVQHGGHSAAAGFTVHNDNLPELIERLQTIASRQLADLDLRHSLRVDALVSLSDLRPELLRDLNALQPTGVDNPPAVFASKGLKVLRSRKVGKDMAHLKLTVTDGRITYDAIAFRQGHWQEDMPPLVDLVYTFEANEYNGFTSLQLNVRDIRKASV
ncbi:MAG: single-stranded-DNA-specific exonuclease RecJ [Chloroflexi bacterium RBG_16_57_11]|nr:MAG: single-stranded-DNA-specific exonuclease RecJ [Chloroflexi bacterium RBG_16_57_11]